MTSREFCYWLQGFYEIQGVGALSKQQSELIQTHLAMVFKHEIDGSYHNSGKLNQIHNKFDKPRC